MGLMLVHSNDDTPVTWGQAFNTAYALGGEAAGDTAATGVGKVAGDTVQYSLFSGVEQQNHTAKGMFFTRFDQITNFGLI